MCSARLNKEWRYLADQLLKLLDAVLLGRFHLNDVRDGNRKVVHHRIARIDRAKRHTVRSPHRDVLVHCIDDVFEIIQRERISIDQNRM